MIDEYSFSMIRPGMTIKDISMLTHTNLQEGLQRIRSFFKDKTFLFLIPGTNKEIEKVLNLLIEKTKLHQYLNIDDRFFEIIHDKYQSTFISSLSKIEFLYLYFDNYLV